jgi:hypothetical protein
VKLAGVDVGVSRAIVSRIPVKLAAQKAWTARAFREKLDMKSGWTITDGVKKSHLKVRRLQ